MSNTPTLVLTRRTMLALGGAVIAAGCSSSTKKAAGTTSPSASAAATKAVGPASATPQPGAKYASAASEISFRGATTSDLAKLTVVGSTSGDHPYDLEAHGDGLGASAVLKSPLTAGETVTVTHGLTTLAGATAGAHTFAVASTEKTATAPIPQTTATQPGYWSFVSEPDLAPVKYKVDQAVSGTPAPGLFFTAPYFFGSHPGGLITDDSNDVVWFKPFDNSKDADANLSGLTVQTYDGKPVLTWWEGTTLLPGLGFGSYHIADQTYTEIQTFTAGNGYDSDAHEMHLTDQGTAYVTAYVATQADLSAVGGDKDGVVLDCVAQEVEPATGRVLWEWHALDHVDLSESHQPITPLPLKQWDAFHMNAIEPVDDDTVLISFRSLHAIFKVTKSTGAVVWRLNGKKSDFTMGAKTKFHSQHDIRLHDAGVVSLFDNGAGAGTDDDPHAGRGLVLTLDETAKTATLTLELATPVKRETASVSQGSTRPLTNGGWVVGWGAGSGFTEFDSTGKAVSDTDLTNLIQSYRTSKLAWEGKPTTKPAVVVKDGSAYVSWNGATAVAQWKLGDGTPVDKKGFETAVPLSGATGSITVSALDSSGTVLATSDPVSV